MHPTILIQAIKLKVGAKQTWYLPDFVVVRADGRLEIHEVKGGFVRDDARVKFQAAVLLYPQFVWVWAQRKNNQWNITTYENGRHQTDPPMS